MRLLSTNTDGSFSLHQFMGNDIPSYAILSHTWEADDQEVTFEDLANALGTGKRGYEKVQFCSKQAKKDGLQYFWMDSCCIDKSNSTELSMSINSMFRWYQDAAKCYVFLSDVSKHNLDLISWSSEVPYESAIRASRWFTRGWTLQELLAPRSVQFFTKEGMLLGDKRSFQHQIHEITGIALSALQGNLLSQFSIDERMSWAEKRQTTIEEDTAYCLLGIFDIYLPLIYGEGKANSVRRLREEISKHSDIRQLEKDQTQRKKMWSDEELSCLQTLRTSEYEQFKDRNPDRLEGTCQWFLQHQHFKNWRLSDSSRLLWVSADPGCGKSVLAKSLISQELKPTESRATCYFFFKDDNKGQKNLATALSALLHQLFSQKPSLIPHALQDYQTEGGQLPQSVHKLWSILMKATSDPTAGEVICILDALDECAESGRYQIIDTLKAFYQTAVGNPGSQLKFLVTSRPYLDIEQRFTELTANFPTIRLQGEQESEMIRHEIDIVIKWRVSKLAPELKLNQSEKSNLESELLRMTHRTYLWLTLVLDIIRKTNRPTNRRLKAVISTLPSTVNQAYEAILSKIEESGRPQVRKLLHIIVAACRPLTLKEMNIALAIEQHHQTYDDLDLDNEVRFESSVRNLCGLFVTVVDQKIYLIHQTAREFLITRGEPLAGRWKYSLNPVESDLVIATTCITYLMFEIFDKATNPVEHAYLDYAARYWTIHYRKAQKIASQDILHSVLMVGYTRLQCFNTWFDIFWNENMAYHHQTPQFTSIVAASYFGHVEVSTLLLEDKSDIDSKDNYGRTGLSWAAENGHGDTVKLLIGSGADVDLKDKNGRPALLWAATMGHEDIVKLLIDARADVDSKDNRGWTALSWAATKGHTGAVKLLVDARADLDSRDLFHRRTPLLWASKNGHGGVVKLLIDAGADINSKDDFEQTALIQAAWEGQDGVVKLLINARAELEPKDMSGRAALSWAAQNRHGDVVKLLIDAGADVDSMDCFGQTVLAREAEKGHHGIVKLLLDAGACIDPEDDFEHTALSRAAKNGHGEVVKLLIKAGADVDREDGSGRTALSWAAKNGHDGVVKLLESFSTE